MRRIGFVISGKENEGRRALIPKDIMKVRHKEYLCFEEGYALHMGVPDSAYTSFGCSIRPTHEVYQCEVICNPKAPELNERTLFGHGQLLFGWIHAVQGRSITDFLLERQMTAIAWEEMYEDGRHCFWRNNEIAGQAAVIHALRYLGRLPQGLNVAVIGRGNCARGALKVLSQLGVTVKTYDRKTEGLLRRELSDFDIVVNAVTWDVFRTDHILYAEDLKRMRPGSMIIDISCDAHMGIETSVPTTISDPIYIRDGILHYAVDHTPAIFYKTATESISEVVSKYIDMIVEGNLNHCLRDATIIADGRILDERIIRFQKRPPIVIPK